jgi:hypothetical protein
MLDVKETKEVLVAGARIVKAASNASADGKYDLADLTYLVPVATSLPSAVEGADKVWAEVQDLDDAEIDELRAAVDAELTTGAFDKLGKHILRGALELAAAASAYKAMQA